jgi:hypothetical protein
MLKAMTEPFRDESARALVVKATGGVVEVAADADPLAVAVAASAGASADDPPAVVLLHLETEAVALAAVADGAHGAERGVTEGRDDSERYSGGE